MPQSPPTLVYDGDCGICRYGSAPQYVRAQLYDYHFADRRTHALTGEWWVRRPQGLYFPQVSLGDFKRAVSDSNSK
jgi:hypothetical protein